MPTTSLRRCFVYVRVACTRYNLCVLDVLNRLVGLEVRSSFLIRVGTLMLLQLPAEKEDFGVFQSVIVLRLTSNRRVDKDSISIT